MSDFQPAQMVINSRMLYFGWVPADPDAVAAMVHPDLKTAANGAVFMNQYVVDADEQTSGFGQYSLTYIGADLEGQDAPTPDTPGRWWTHYFNSSAPMREYVIERGVPATPGRTELVLEGDRLVATTYSDDTPVIRTTAKAGSPCAVARGQLNYITEIDGKLVSGLYPYVADVVDPWGIESLEFLDPSHSVYALRPADPHETVWGFYSPSASFCYPGGETVVG